MSGHKLNSNKKYPMSYFRLFQRKYIYIYILKKTIFDWLYYDVSIIYWKMLFVEFLVFICSATIVYYIYITYYNFITLRVHWAKLLCDYIITMFRVDFCQYMIFTTQLFIHLFFDHFQFFCLPSISHRYLQNL